MSRDTWIHGPLSVRGLVGDIPGGTTGPKDPPVWLHQFLLEFFLDET